MALLAAGFIYSLYGVRAGYLKRNINEAINNSTSERGFNSNQLRTNDYNSTCHYGHIMAPARRRSQPLPPLPSIRSPYMTITRRLSPFLRHSSTPSPLPNINDFALARSTLQQERTLSSAPFGPVPHPPNAVQVREFPRTHMYS